MARHVPGVGGVAMQIQQSLHPQDHVTSQMPEPDQVQTLTLSDERWRRIEKEFPEAANHRLPLEQASAELVALKGKGGGKRGGGQPPSRELRDRLTETRLISRLEKIFHKYPPTDPTAAFGTLSHWKAESNAHIDRLRALGRDARKKICFDVLEIWEREGRKVGVAISCPTTRFLVELSNSTIAQSTARAYAADYRRYRQATRKLHILQSQTLTTASPTFEQPSVGIVQHN